MADQTNAEEESVVEEQSVTEVTLSEPENMPAYYANLCGIASSAEEVIFTFAQRDIGDPTQAKGIVRVYTSPAHARRIAEVLTRVMEAHREQSIQALPEEIRKLMENQVDDASDGSKTPNNDK